MLNKLYKKKKKFESTENNFDFKLTIYLDKCKHVDLLEYAYEKEVLIMLTDEALIRYYVNRVNFITFNVFALVCKHTLKVLSDKVIISINDTVSSLKTSLQSIRTFH